MITTLTEAGSTENQVRSTPTAEVPEEHVTRTLFERFVGLIPLPYTASCIVLTLAFGIPGTLLTRYLDSRSLAQAFSYAGTVTGSPGYWRAIVFYWAVAYGVFLFYLFYFVRYFRRQVMKARTELSPLLTGGEQAFDKDFRIVSSPVGALAITAVIGGCFAPSVYKMVANSLGNLSGAHVVLSQSILYLAGGTGIWLFFSSVWSLRKLATESMRLKPSSEDPLLGLGPIGSICLALILTYFGALTLRGVGILASGVEMTPVAVNLAFESILMTSGLVVFLLTINVFHKKMVGQKELERRRLLADRMILQTSIMDDKPKDGDNPNHMGKLLAMDLVERRLERVRTWPFDTPVLGHTLTILLSVIAIMVARVILVATNL